ncbi:MAG: glycosyltransferase family 4 protein [Prevotella sp.]
MKRVMMVGSAEQSAGGVASVIRMMKKMPVWEKYGCYWLGTQIQRNYAWKLWYAVKGNIKALFIIWRYDIIHFHAVPDMNGMIIQLPVFLLALISRKKIIMHLHVGNQLTKHTSDRFFIWLLRHSDCIVLLANKWKELFDKNYPTVNVRKRVVYNACEIAEAPSYEGREKTIIMAAYLNDNKAPDVLLKAWDKIHDRYPDWKILIMGNGEVERFKAMAHSMKLDDSVHFTGYVTGKEKEDIWRKASIYCMCSYEEGFPMVVLEAWAKGVAVVTTPVGGLPDVIDEGKNCLTFGFGDYDELAEKLCTLMEDEKLRKDIATVGKEVVEDDFCAEKINKDIESLYNGLLTTSHTK